MESKLSLSLYIYIYTYKFITVSTAWQKNLNHQLSPSRLRPQVAARPWDLQAFQDVLIEIAPKWAPKSPVFFVGWRIIPLFGMKKLRGNPFIYFRPFLSRSMVAVFTSTWKTGLEKKRSVGSSGPMQPGTGSQLLRCFHTAPV